MPVHPQPESIAAQMGDSAAPALSNNPTYSAYQVVFPALSGAPDRRYPDRQRRACLHGSSGLLVSRGLRLDPARVLQLYREGGQMPRMRGRSESSFTWPMLRQPIHPEDMGFNSDTATFFGPAVMISLSDGQALKTTSIAMPANGDHQPLGKRAGSGDLQPRLAGISPALTGNMLASYSSRGPAPDGIIKPDLVAVSGVETDSSKLRPRSE